MTSDYGRQERAIGALIGAIIGDALGAPYEFGPPGRLGWRFPQPVLLDPAEMTGGGQWAAAEWTDDTQTGLLVAQSLLDQGGLDEHDLFRRFVDWRSGHPKDVGIQTSEVLGSGIGWREAASTQFRRSGKAAGNGSLMRTIPAAVFFATDGRAASAEAARRISALTHGDPAAGDGCAIYHELVRVALDGHDPLDAIDDALELLPPQRRDLFAQRLDPGYDPATDVITNGAVWPTLATAVWALRRTTSFEDAVRAAVDVGGDTDTVACVTGGLAGAVYSIGAIPSRWTTYLHGELIGRGDSGLGLEDLQSLGRSLEAGRWIHNSGPPTERAVEPMLVGGDHAVYAASFPGVVAAVDARTLAPGTMIISLSRTSGQLDGYRPRRQVWLADQDTPGTNGAICAVLDDVVDTIEAALEAGQPVIVHCHGGRSRTGLVLRAWLLRRSPRMTVEEGANEVAGRWPHLDLWNTAFSVALEEWAARRGRAEA